MKSRAQVREFEVAQSETENSNIVSDVRSRLADSQSQLTVLRDAHNQLQQSSSRARDQAALLTNRLKALRNQNLDLRQQHVQMLESSSRSSRVSHANNSAASESWLSDAQLLRLWKPAAVQKLPSSSNPFLFYHQRKTGGSSIRRMVVAAAKKHRLRLFSPGVVPTEWAHYSIDSLSTAANRSKVSVLAAHMHWGQNEALLQERSTSTQLGAAGSGSVSRFSVLRRPVDRVISCYYYRFFDDMQVHMADLDAHTLRQTLLFRVDKFGHGCLNEPLRVLSGSVDEAGINTANLSSLMGQHLLQRSKQHLLSCVVGVTHLWQQTGRSLSFFFPWVTFLPAVRDMTTRTIPPAVKDKLKRNNLLIVLEELTSLEQDLFSFSLQLFAMQQQHVATALARP